MYFYICVSTDVLFFILFLSYVWNINAQKICDNFITKWQIYHIKH
jgi:hypothetical protein